MCKAIIAMILVAVLARADFVGFPLATNATWQQCRSVGAISQLWEAVQERCMVLTNSGVPILDIVETWPVQIGYSNQVYTQTVGSNTFERTNLNPYYVTITTTNQAWDVTVSVTNLLSEPWFSKLHSNATDTVTLFLPVTHDFITALDSRLFSITPYFVNTHRSTHGNFNAYFSPFGASTAYSNYVDGLVPTEWPYHCVASVMANAGVGYITNLVYDSFTNIIGGNAWFTRQPAVTNAWAIWQAVRAGENSVLVSGMTDAALNGTYIKRLQGDSWLGGWWPTSNPTEQNFPIDPTLTAIYVKLDMTSVITRRGAISTANAGPGVGPYYLWSIDKLQQPPNPDSYTVYNRLQYGWVRRQRDVAEFSNIEVGPSTSAVYSYDDGEVWEEVTNKWNILSSTLITSNNWRNIPRRVFPNYRSKWGPGAGYFPLTGSDYWGGDIWGGVYFGSETFDSWTNYPAIVGASVVATVTTNWVCRPLANYDVRYYDEGPRPFYSVRINGTNAFSLDVQMAGDAFLNLSEPDFDGEQVVGYATEAKTLTTSNTPSAFRWFSAQSTTNVSVTGEAPVGSVVVLMWTNSHSFDRLPYRLEAKDLDERWAYLRELVWTTVPYSWVGTQEAFTNYVDSTNVEINVIAGGYYYNGWENEFDWKDYRDTFITGERDGWNAGSFAGYFDPKYEIAFYTNYPGMTNFDYYPVVINSAPQIEVSAHAIATRESRAMWRTSISFNDSWMVYPCDPGYEYGYLGWFTIFPEPDRLYGKPWLYDMTDSSPTFQPQGGDETGIGYEGPNDPFNCGDAGNNYVSQAARPGSPSFALEKDYGYEATAYKSSLRLTDIDCRTPQDSNSKVEFDAQVYVGIYSPVVFKPLQMFDSYTNVTTGSVVSLPYEISLDGVTNILTTPPFFSYTGTQSEEQVIWKYVVDPFEIVGPLFQERSYGIYVNPLSNEVVYTTNDVVIRWFHIPASTNDPYISESNTYYSATNVPQFQWSNIVADATTRVEYTANTIVIPYVAVEAQTNYSPGTYPSYWANYPDNIWALTEYDYGTITTNYTLQRVVTTTSLVWSGFNEWATIATTTNATTNGVSYPGTGGWVHTPTNDILEYGGFYSDFATASNRLVALGLSAYVTNLQNRLVCFTQDVLVAHYATVTIIVSGNRREVGTRDTWEESCYQEQNHSVDFTATATAPECLIKWHFRRK